MSTPPNGEIGAILDSDVLVIGAGIAGLTAAAQAAEAGAEVTVLSKGPITRDGAASWMAGTGFQVALYPPDSPEEHARDTIRVGQYLNNQELLLAVTNEIPRCLHRLDHWGMHYLKSGGKYVQLVFPGSRHPRVPRLYRAGAMAGPELRRIFPKQLRRLGVRALGNMQALELLKRNGAVVGALALDVIDGRFVAFRAKAVIVATGGFMGMYRFTATSPTLVGEGHGMAYRAGAQLQDIEFGDFYTGCLAWPPAYAGELDLATSLRYALKGIVYNSQGEDVWRSKRVAGLAQPVVFQQEIRAGRCSPHGGLYLSFKHLPDNLIEDHIASLGPTRLVSYLKIIGIDIRREALEIAPAPLESMGGCRVNARLQTNVPGLFAAGEVVGGAEGAYTMAGNPLPIYTAMGSIAGREAAAYARETGKVPDDLPDTRPFIQSALKPMANGARGAIPALEVRRELQDILRDHLHLLGRTEAGLGSALDRILAIRAGADKWQVRTATRRHNNEWMECLELGHMLTASEMMARAALARKESRGLHFREDYPEPSPDWLCNVVIERDGEQMKVSKVPVAFTFVRPGER